MGGTVFDSPAPDALRVATVCTGNICRSPMAEVLIKHLVAQDEVLSGHVVVTSAGTANWHEGLPMDRRARRALDRAGLHLEGSPARYADEDFLIDQDLVLVMTREHFHDVRDRVGTGGTDVKLWRHLTDPDRDLDVADPYYGDDRDFDRCLSLLRAAGPSLTSELRRRWGERSPEA